MREYMAFILRRFTVILEFVISVMLAIGIVILCGRLAMNLANIANFDKWPNYDDLLQQCFNLIIGVELIRMMVYHTPSTVFEVLLFALARQIIIDHSSPLHSLIGVLCIAGLFATRKFLFSEFDVADKTIIRGNSRVKNVNRLLHLQIPMNKGETVSDVILAECEEKNLKVATGTFIEYATFGLGISKMKNGEITRVEIIRAIH